MNNAHGTTQVTDEQIITIFHLALQVYCSPSLKEHLHNPVMTLLACNIERTVSILCAHGVMCGVVCMNICVLHVHVCGCVYKCIRFVHSFAQCLPNGGYKSTSILSVITQAQNNTYSFGNC